MSYYNPDIYNYGNLKEEDKIYINYYRWGVEAVENYEPIEWEGENEEETVFEKIKREIEQEFKEKLLEHLRIEETELIVAIMDNYEEDYVLPNEKEENNVSSNDKD